MKAYLLAAPLLLAVLAGCASSETPGTTPRQDSRGRYIIDLTADNKIVPDEARVPVGAVVAWQVGSGGVHDVTSTSGPESFTSDERFPQKMRGGDEYERPFTKAGTYQYKCVLHGEMMSATLRVADV